MENRKNTFLDLINLNRKINDNLASKEELLLFDEKKKLFLLQVELERLDTVIALSNILGENNEPYFSVEYLYDKYLLNY